MTQPWYPFYWGDYSAKTLHLTQGQHGAFLLLLRYIYTTSQPIPDEHRFSIARASLEQERSDVDFVLASFFTLQDGVWRNLKAEEIITEAEAKHQARVKAGKKGGKRKASNAKAKPKPGSTNHNHNHNTSTEDKSSSEGAREMWMPEDWVPREPWDAFIRMRGKIKKAPDDHTKGLLVKTLKRLVADGEDATAVLEQSTMNQWAGLFAVKNRSGKAPHAAAPKSGAPKFNRTIT